MKGKDLKNSILQMAVQGKLVPQDPGDEPASVLLERIRGERRRLIAEGKLKAPKGGESVIYRASDGSHYEKRIDAKGRVLSDECIEDEIPFEIPESWEWARLGFIFDMQAGRNISASKINKERNNRYCNPCFGGNGIRGFVETPNRDGRHPVVGRQGALCGCVNLAEGKFYATEHAIVTTCLGETDVDWGCFVLEALNLNQYATATAQPGLAVSKIIEVLVPVPPAFEQIRIAEQLTNLKPLLLQYDALESARQQLDAELPDRLRKSVLQQAVQGKLVPQDPADEPASVLLGRIREERRRLIAEGGLKAPKGGESVIYRASDGSYYEKRVDAKGREGEPVCIDDEIPFEIPGSWEWARLGSLCNYGQCRNVEYNDIDDGTWVLELEDIEKGSGKVSSKSRKIKGTGSTKHLFNAGDVLYSKLRPYLNKVVIADEAGAATSEIFPLDFLGLTDGRYAQSVLMSPFFLEYANSCSYGVKMPRLGTTNGQRAFFPLPPLEEQRRIIAIAERLSSLFTNQ